MVPHKKQESLRRFFGGSHKSHSHRQNDLELVDGNDAGVELVAGHAPQTDARIADADAKLNRNCSLHPLFRQPVRPSSNTRPATNGHDPKDPNDLRHHAHLPASHSAPDPPEQPSPPLPSPPPAHDFLSQTPPLHLSERELPSAFASHSFPLCWSESLITRPSDSVASSDSADATGALEGSSDSEWADALHRQLVKRNGNGMPRAESIISSLARLRELVKANSANSGGSNELWTDRFAPISANDIVSGSPTPIASLKSWLHSWAPMQRQPSANQQCNGESKGRHAKRRRLSSQSGSDWASSDDDDFAIASYAAAYADGDLSNGGVAANAQAVLLYGPSGSGKSAAVHACARELGLRVLEVNGTGKRNGSNVNAKFSEASLSMRIARSVDNCQRTSFKKQKSKRHQASETGQAAESDPSNIQLGDDTLLLFEEVDTADEEDRGFFLAIADIACCSKRPVLLTANAPLPQGALDDLFFSQVPIERPNEGELIYWLACVARAEHKAVHLGQLQAISQLCQQDVRRSLLFLQLLLCSSPSQEHPGKLLLQSETIAHVGRARALMRKDPEGPDEGAHHPREERFKNAMHAMNCEKQNWKWRNASESAQRFRRSQSESVLRKGPAQRRLDAVVPNGMNTSLHCSTDDQGDSVAQAIKLADECSTSVAETEKDRQDLLRAERRVFAGCANDGHCSLGHACALAFRLSACDILRVGNWRSLRGPLPATGKLRSDDDEECEPSGSTAGWGMHQGIASECAEWLAQMELTRSPDVNCISPAEAHEGSLKLPEPPAADSLRDYAALAAQHAATLSAEESAEVASMAAIAAKHEKQRLASMQGRTKRANQRLTMERSAMDTLVRTFTCDWASRHGSI